MKEISIRELKSCNATKTQKEVKLQEHREDTLTPRADEGRDKLRKAMGRSKYSLIHRYPNEETQLEKII